MTRRPRLDERRELCEDLIMRVPLVLCAALSLACDGRPDAGQPSAPAVASSDGERFARWQEATVRQIEADARAGATMVFKDTTTRR